jgi:hypothetical protein
MKTTANLNTVQKALETVNKKHGYKIIFNRCDQSGKWLNFTIRSEKSNIPGARVSHSGKNLTSASWHAHGFLFDEIFKLDPDAIIQSAGAKITKEHGNWIDKNIGSINAPCYFSDTSIL